MRKKHTHFISIVQVSLGELEDILLGIGGVDDLSVFYSASREMKRHNIGIRIAIREFQIRLCVVEGIRIDNFN